MKEKGIKIIEALAKLKSQDCVGGFYAVYEVPEELVLEAKQYLKDIKKKGKK